MTFISNSSSASPHAGIPDSRPIPRTRAVGARPATTICNDDDVTQQRCRGWAHAVYHSAPNKKTASGETSDTAASPARHPPWRKQMKEKSQ